MYLICRPRHPVRTGILAFRTRTIINAHTGAIKSLVTDKGKRYVVFGIFRSLVVRRLKEHLLLGLLRGKDLEFFFREGLVRRDGIWGEG